MSYPHYSSRSASFLKPDTGTQICSCQYLRYLQSPSSLGIHISSSWSFQQDLPSKQSMREDMDMLPRHNQEFSFFRSPAQDKFQKSHSSSSSILWPSTAISLLCPAKPFLLQLSLVQLTIKEFCKTQNVQKYGGWMTTSRQHNSQVLLCLLET